MLHPHQRAALVRRLKEADFADLSCGDAYALLHADKNLMGLRGVQFAHGKKALRPGFVEVGAEVAAEFPKGIPGMPNLIRREDFDSAWEEARNG